LGRNGVEFETIEAGLSNASLDIIRQKIDDNNYEMINLLLSQMMTMLNPFVHSTIGSFQKVVDQMAQISDSFGNPSRR